MGDRRGVRSWAYLSAGSNTTIKSTTGSLYTVHVNDASGGTVVVADAVNLGATPNLNDATLAGTLARFGPLPNAGPFTVRFDGIGLNAGLTVAATSNAQVTVEYE